MNLREQNSPFSCDQRPLHWKRAKIHCARSIGRQRRPKSIPTDDSTGPCFVLWIFHAPFVFALRRTSKSCRQWLIHYSQQPNNILYISSLWQCSASSSIWSPAVAIRKMAKSVWPPFGRWPHSRINKTRYLRQIYFSENIIQCATVILERIKSEQFTTRRWSLAKSEWQKSRRRVEMA